MAEFPDLGEHCSVSTCRQLDFLPIKCDACEQVYCSGHMTYDSHNCQSTFRKDVQVPVCPLCNQPVPIPKGSLPDVIVGQHIDNDCRSDRAKGKIYSNRCNKKGCKKRELVPVLCAECKLNFCLTHRHSADHDCSGPPPTRSNGMNTSKAAAAAFSRFFGGSSSSAAHPSSAAVSSKSAGNSPARHRQSQPPGRSQPVAAGAQMNNQMSEDEALAMAMQLSLAEGSAEPTQEQRDAQLAADLQRQEYQAVSAGGPDNNQRLGGNDGLRGRSRSQQCRVS